MKHFIPFRRQAGFTLVELLVVIGIIAVLIAILLPALNKARDQANKISCASNVRQLAMTSLMYAADNKNILPAGTGLSYLAWNGDYHQAGKHSFLQYARQYLRVSDVAPALTDDAAVESNLRFKTPGVLICPSAPRQANYYRLNYSYFGGGADPVGGGPGAYAMKINLLVAAGKKRASNGRFLSGPPALWADRCPVGLNPAAANNSGGIAETNHWDRTKIRPSGGNVASVDGSVIWMPLSNDPTATDSFVQPSGAIMPANIYYIPSNAIVVGVDGSNKIVAPGLTYGGSGMGSNWRYTRELFP